MHRLNVAGRNSSIFSDEAIRLIYEHSGGIPRRINRICDLSLLSGFGKNVNVVDKAIVEEELSSFGS